MYVVVGHADGQARPIAQRVGRIANGLANIADRTGYPGTQPRNVRIANIGNLFDKVFNVGKESTQFVTGIIPHVRAAPTEVGGSIPACPMQGLGSVIQIRIH